MKKASRPDVTLFIPNLEIGGAERVSKNILNGLAERGLRVHLLLMEKSGPLLDELHPAIEIFSLDARRVRTTLPSLIGYLRKHRPENLMVHMWPLTILASLAKLLSFSATRLIFVEHIPLSRHEFDRGRWHSWMVRVTVRLFYPLAHHVVAVSAGAADDLTACSGLPRDKIAVVFNPVVRSDGPRFDRDTEFHGKAWWNASRFQILSVGTLKKQKDLENLITAFSLVVRELDARLLIVGDGPERAPLMALVEKLRIEDRVLFVGTVSDARPYYPSASLFVLSSLYEGLPTTLIEALEAGIPIVSTNCPSGPLEILESGRYGRLVPPADSPALAAAMLEALQTEPPDAQVLRERAQEFTVDVGIRRYLSLLEL